MFVCFGCCVLSGRGLFDGLITRPGESYRLWCVVVCDQETSKNEEAKARYRAVKMQPQCVVTPREQTNNGTDREPGQQLQSPAYGLDDPVLDSSRQLEAHFFCAGKGGKSVQLTTHVRPRRGDECVDLYTYTLHIRLHRLDRRFLLRTYATTQA